MPFIIALIFLSVTLGLFMLILRILFSYTFSKKKKTPDSSRDIPNHKQYNAVKDRMLEMIDRLEETPFEEVTVKSYDGLKLYGRYYDRGNPCVIEIAFHGYHGHAIRDFCGGASIQQKGGISSILVDQRSHENSEGSSVTFGLKERYDVITWINYVRNRFGDNVRIILTGVSMGAATVLMACELGLPENVVGIIADCPFSSAREIIMRVTSHKKLPVKPTYFLIKLSAKIFAGVDIEKTSAVEAVKHTKIPVLFIHGDDDRLVPYSMGKQIYEACASDNKQFLTVHGAGHGLSYFVDTYEYTKTVTDFIKSVA